MTTGKVTGPGQWACLDPGTCRRLVTAGALTAVPGLGAGGDGS